jgi:hypothetical protein
MSIGPGLLQKRGGKATPLEPTLNVAVSVNVVMRFSVTEIWSVVGAEGASEGFTNL